MTYLSVYSLGNDPLRVADMVKDDGVPAGSNYTADIRAVIIQGASGAINHFGGLGLANVNFVGLNNTFNAAGDTVIEGDNAGQTWDHDGDGSDANTAAGNTDGPNSTELTQNILRRTGVYAPNVRIHQYLRIGDFNTMNMATPNPVDGGVTDDTPAVTDAPVIIIDPLSALKQDGGMVQINGGDINTQPVDLGTDGAVGGGDDTPARPIMTWIDQTGDTTVGTGNGGETVNSGARSFPFIAVDGMHSFDSDGSPGVRYASRELNTDDFATVLEADISRESMASILFQIDGDTEQADVTAFFAKDADHNGRTIIIHSTEGTTWDGWMIGNNDLSDSTLLFEVDVTDAVLWSQAFNDLIFEEDVSGIFVTSELLEGGTSNNLLDPYDPEVEGALKEGGIGNVIIWGTLSNGGIGVSFEGQSIGKVTVGTASGGGMSDNLLSHAGAAGIFNALGSTAMNSSFGGLTAYNADRDTVLEIRGDETLVHIVNGNITGNIDFKTDIMQSRETDGAIVHLIESDIEDGVAFSTKSIMGMNTQLDGVIYRYTYTAGSAVGANDRPTFGGIAANGEDNDLTITGGKPRRHREIRRRTEHNGQCRWSLDGGWRHLSGRRHLGRDLGLRRYYGRRRNRHRRGRP